MIAHCSNWDIATNIGNTLPLHGQLQQTNMSQTIPNCFTNSVQSPPANFISSLHEKMWLSQYDSILETFWSSLTLWW
jgi:hypothetical protein